MKKTYMTVLISMFMIVSCSDFKRKSSDKGPKDRENNQLTADTCKELDAMVDLLKKNDRDRDSILNMMVTHQSQWAKLSRKEIQDVWACYTQK